MNISEKLIFLSTEQYLLKKIQCPRVFRLSQPEDGLLAHHCVLICLRDVDK